MPIKKKKERKKRADGSLAKSLQSDLDLEILAQLWNIAHTTNHTAARLSSFVMDVRVRVVVWVRAVFVRLDVGCIPKLKRDLELGIHFWYCGHEQF